MVSLKKTSGLDLSLDTQSCHLSFGKELVAPMPAIRSLEQMQEVLLDPDIKNPQELYYMYRDVHILKDTQLLKENKLRYDVTVIKPDCLGRELMKTAGHYHEGIFGELYEVLEGRAFCLLQKPDPGDYRTILDVILVEAKAGQKIVIPPGYGHILVNPGPGCLVTSNWVSSAFTSQYELYKVARGAAYYLVSVKDKLEFTKNPFFKQLPEIIFAQPAKRIDKFGLEDNTPIYPLVSSDADKLKFLNYPDKYDYSDVFNIIKP
jgi:glucose-6-phosphate isomerase